MAGKVLRPLRNPLFRRLWLGHMTANLGTMFQSVGAAWMMTTMTGSPQMVALVQSSLTLPLLLLSLFAGVLADTLDRRKIMIWAQIHMCAMASALTLVVVAGRVTPEMLLLFTFLIGCGGALTIPSWQASLRDIVDRDEIASAVAIHSMGFNLMRSAGPALGGVILAAAGAAALFALNAAGYLFLLAVLLLWRTSLPRVAMQEPFGSALRSGLRYSALSPSLVGVFVRGAVFCLLAVSLVALLPVLAADTLGGGSVLYGALLACFGLGAVAAAVIATSLRDRASVERIVTVSFLVFAAALLLIVTMPRVWAAYPAVFAAGCCWVLTNSTLNVTIQLSTPKWVVGRSLSILHTGLFGGMALGSWAWGAVAETAGVQKALLASALALVVAAPMGRFLPLPVLGGTRLEPSNRFREPELKLDLARHPGPISIAIHFRIAPEDVAEFLTVMAERRRVRRRDGALRWSLRRDVERPDHWTESYEVPSWADYVRHNLRRTEADAGLQDRLWALHSGEQPPAVHRLVEWGTSQGSGISDGEKRSGTGRVVEPE